MQKQAILNGKTLIRKNLHHGSSIWILIISVVGQYLPTGGFKWMDVSKIEDWKKNLEQKDEQDDGYFL